MKSNKARPSAQVCVCSKYLHAKSLRIAGEVNDAYGWVIATRGDPP